MSNKNDFDRKYIVETSYYKNGLVNVSYPNLLGQVLQTNSMTDFYREDSPNSSIQCGCIVGCLA
jgi:hypothetical protein